MVAPFSTGRMGTGLWRAAGWKLQAAPHISLPCWVSYPLTGAAKNDISLTTVPDLIREGGKQCQTLALPGSMPPLLCHDSFQVTMLCAKLIQDMFFARSSVFGHKYGNLHIFHGVCLLVDHSSLVAGSSVGIFFPWCFFVDHLHRPSCEPSTSFCWISVSESSESPVLLGGFFRLDRDFTLWFFKMDSHVVQKVWSPETRPQVGGKSSFGRADDFFLKAGRLVRTS